MAHVSWPSFSYIHERIEHTRVLFQVRKYLFVICKSMDG
ncbi:hypothetical protein T11_11909 [Trichinella zimbabwensis]|uniref:Uncharacterized protein n=1 Tax=Trichinella zimbabwensis TaxID=268475 RepID=A0A0V1I7Y3_9BILA|nr:hypothetical protein T11_11909 [Trichinella zimbabwensis]